MHIHGHCDAAFLDVKDTFRQNFDEGLEFGATVAVTHGGRYVCDLWAGYADPERQSGGCTKSPSCAFLSRMGLRRARMFSISTRNENAIAE